MGQQGRPGWCFAAPSHPAPAGTAPSRAQRGRPLLLRLPTHFDLRWALAKAADIVEDIRTVDERLGDGILVDGALVLLSDSYRRLTGAGVPPGLDHAAYLDRVTTLHAFAGRAADAYDLDPVDATAQYLVVREETGVLFQQINAAIGSRLALP